MFLAVTNFTKSDEIKSILTEFEIDNNDKLKQHIIFFTVPVLDFNVF